MDSYLKYTGISFAYRTPGERMHSGVAFYKRDFPLLERVGGFFKKVYFHSPFYSLFLIWTSPVK